MGIRKNTIKIKTALISLSDKSNLKPLLNLLKKYKIKIISSGGTYKKIKSMGFKCLEVSKFTNSTAVSYTHLTLPTTNSV